MKDTGVFDRLFIFPVSLFFVVVILNIYIQGMYAPFNLDYIRTCIFCICYKNQLSNLKYIFQSVDHMQKILIRAPLCRHPIVITLSVHICLSIRPSVSMSNGKRCLVTYNHASRSLVKVKADLYTKSLSGAYFLSPCSNLAYTLLTESLWSKNVQRS